MATKRTVKTENEEQLLEQQAEEPEKETESGMKDPWDETVDMVVPRKPKGDDQQFYVCVNDRRYMVPADGKMQTLPQPVAEVLQAAIQAEYAAEDFADHIPNRSGEMPQQHAI